MIAEIKDGDVTNYIRGVTGIIYSKDKKGTKTYYVTNNHGDVTALVNSSGNIIKEYTYDEYGVEKNPDKSDKNPFRYCGEYFDIETGFIYLRARYYDPTLGRFISEDPARDEINWYVYCSGNPVNAFDPSGLISVIFVSSNMEKQADDRKKYYTEKYGTDSYKIIVDSANSFVEKWNNFFDIASKNNVNIDAIEIISHGSIDGKIGKDSGGTAYSTGYIYFTDSKKNKLYARYNNSMRKGDCSIADLRSVSSSEMNLEGCNTANPDTYNVVYGFMQKVNAKTYSGFDGGSKWDNNIKDHVRGGGEYGVTRAHPFNPAYYVKEYQHTWWKYVEKNEDGSPARARYGRRCFTK